MSFTDAEEDRLIHIVSQNPTVFDTSHEGYRNIQYKDTVWQQIAEQLGKTSEDCKKKWKFIRDGYKRFIKRHPQGSFIPKYSKNKRHQQLSFLENYSFNEVSCYVDETSPDVHVKTEGQSETDPIAYHKEESTQNSTENEEPSSDEDKPLRKPKIKRRKKNIPDIEDVLQQMQDSEERTQALLRTIMKRKDDDIEHFCRHIAQVLRKLPPVERAQAKKHLGAVLSEHEITAAKSSNHIDLS